MINTYAYDSATLTAMEDAALVESFDPIALAGKDAALAPKILAQLASVSDEVATAQTLAWKLRSDARQTLLSALAASSRLDSALDRHAAEQTPFGRYLVTAMRGMTLESLPPSQDERETAIVAYEVATASLAAANSHAAELKLKVAQQELANLRAQASLEAERQRSETILSGPLIGRREERAALTHYIATGESVAAHALLPPAAPIVSQRSFLITGCGGAGKSALLADLIREYRKPGMRGSVVLLDFDRPSNCRGGPAEWYSELTRQLSLGNPAMAQRMKRLRHEARERVSPIGKSDGLSGRMIAEEIHKGLVRALIEQKAAGEPLLVVLDTFEEVLTRSNLGLAGSNLLRDVLGWTAELTTIQDYQNPGVTAFSTVRIIVSGRVAPDLGVGLRDWFCGTMEIGALDPESARAFLKRRDKDRLLSASQIDRAVDVIGGHPLSLILFERFVRQQPTAVDEVLEQGDLSRVMSGEDAARSLYSRFLLRLNVRTNGDEPVDPEKVRSIAHPGLVLREVSAVHIAEIIAPGCDVALEPGEAEKLFRQLTEQVWLVEKIMGRTPPTVRHRADVRRLMLPMMSGAVRSSDGHDIGEQVRRVRRLAAEWFQARSKGLDEYAVEAAYHRAFLDDIPDIHHAALWKLVWNLSPDDVSAMPPRAAALVRYHGRGASSLSREQIEALPDGLRSSAAVEQTDANIAAGHFGEAAASAELVQSAPRSTIERNQTAGKFAAPRWSQSDRSLYVLARDPALAAEVNAAFHSGNYDKAATIGWDAIAERSGTTLREPLPIEEDITFHWIWRSALARMVASDSGPSDMWLNDFVRELLLPERMQKAELKSANLVLAAAAYVACRGECEIPVHSAGELAALANRSTSLVTSDDARLLTLTVIASGRDLRIFARLQPGIVPVPASKQTLGQLSFRQPNRATGTAARSWTNSYFLLNARLPELVPLVLAIAGPEMQRDSERLVDAIGALQQLLPDGLPSELDANYLRQRLGEGGQGGSAIASTVAVADAYGMLPDLTKEFCLRGPTNHDLAKLFELIATYTRVLGFSF